MSPSKSRGIARLFVAKSQLAPLLIDVSMTHVVPTGVLEAQRTTDPVTGAPVSVNWSLTQ
jgi:hypothetical protein